MTYKLKAGHEYLAFQHASAALMQTLDETCVAAHLTHGCCVASVDAACCHHMMLPAETLGRSNIRCCCFLQAIANTDQIVLLCDKNSDFHTIGFASCQETNCASAMAEFCKQ